MTTGSPAGSEAGMQCVGSPELPCKRQGITGRFDKVLAKCGDKVGLIASGTNIPDKTKVAFDIRDYPVGTHGDTKKAIMHSRLVTNKKWVTKKFVFGGDKYVDFRVSASKASADSINQLRIYKYPDFASYLWSVTRNAPNHGINFVVKGKFDIEFKVGVLIITVKIKLINYNCIQPPRGVNRALLAKCTDNNGNYVPVDDITKNDIKNSAEQLLSGKWLLHRRNCLRGSKCDCLVDMRCCKFPIKIKVLFVETGEHHTVNLFLGKNTVVNAGEWGRVPWDNLDYGHEIGHLLGWYDEYDNPPDWSGAIAPVADRPPWKVNRPNSLMNCSGSYIPRLYYRDFKGHFRLKTDEPWVLVRK